MPDIYTTAFIVLCLTILYLSWGVLLWVLDEFRFRKLKRNLCNSTNSTTGDESSSATIKIQTHFH